MQTIISNTNNLIQSGNYKWFLKASPKIACVQFTNHNDNLTLAPHSQQPTEHIAECSARLLDFCLVSRIQLPTKQIGEYYEELFNLHSITKLASRWILSLIYQLPTKLITGVS